MMSSAPADPGRFSAPAAPGGAEAAPWWDRGWIAPFAGLLLLQLARLLQGPDLLPLWFPGAGLSLAFLAWFGVGVVGLLILDLVLGVGVGWLLSQPHPGLALVGGLLQIAQVTAG